MSNSESYQRIIFDPSMSLRELLQFRDRDDVSLLCPRCGAALKFLLTPDEAGPFNVHPGIYCLAAKEPHVAVWIDFREPRTNQE